ncbi:hypothetical protein Golomagni_06812, partial [Golovinomyces magnicellulatus]
EALGEGVTEFAVGDHICVQPTIHDGTCRACKRGLSNSCDSFGFVGLSGWGGGMSQLTTVPANYAKKLPADMPLEIGALVEPLAVGWHAVANSPFKEGDSVLVLGGGPIGLSVILALIARNCDNIIVAEISNRRRQFALDFGAHHVINPLEEDVVSKTAELTQGQGVDVCFDAAGVQSAVDTGLKSVKARGTFVNIALWGAKRVSLDMTVMLFGERKYIAGTSFPTKTHLIIPRTDQLAVVTYTEGDFEGVIEAIHSGRMDPKAMITKIIRPDEVAEEGFKALTDDKDNQVKILVDMSKV